MLPTDFQSVTLRFGRTVRSCLELASFHLRRAKVPTSRKAADQYSSNLQSIPLNQIQVLLLHRLSANFRIERVLIISKWADHTFAI